MLDQQNPGTAEVEELGRSGEQYDEPQALYRTKVLNEASQLFSIAQSRAQPSTSQTEATRESRIA